ncbi:MAG: hypothetical protein ACLUJG_01825 [Lawsonibacter sp.]
MLSCIWIKVPERRPPMDRFNRILLLVIALAALVLPYLTRQ